MKVWCEVNILKKMSDTYSEFMRSLKPGVWIKVRCRASGTKKQTFGYWHHGIVSNVNGEEILVIHFGQPENKEKSELEVVETSLEWFLSNGEDPRIVDGEPAYEFEEVVERAMSYVGSAGYKLPLRNCEHFASHCYSGSAFSKQVYGFGIVAGVTAAVFSVLSIIALRLSKTRWV